MTFLNDWKSTRKESYPFIRLTTVDDINITISEDMDFLQRFGRIASQSRQHKSGGFMQKVGSEWVDVTEIKQ